MGYKDMTNEGKPKRKWMKKVQPQTGSSVQDVLPEEHADSPVSSYQDGAGENVSSAEFQRRNAAREAAKNKKSIARAPVIVDGSDVAPQVSEQLQKDLEQAVADDLELGKLVVVPDETAIVLAEAMDKLEENRTLLLEARTALEAEVAKNKTLQGRLSEAEHLVQSLQDDTERLAAEKKDLQDVLTATIEVTSIEKTKRGKVKIRLLCNVADGTRIIEFPLLHLQEKLSGGKQ